MAKTTIGAGPKIFMLFIYFCLISHTSTVIFSQTKKASCQLFSVPLICSVKVITLQIKRMINMPTFYHSDKTKAQLLGSRIKQWNLLDKGVTVSLSRKRQWDTATCYLIDGNLAYCKNIHEWVEELQLEHTSGQWMHFTDSSKVSLKAVLLHNGNKFHSIPMARAVHVKEMMRTFRFCCKKYIWRTLVEYMCQPESYSNADWAGKWIH
jgi:DNA gyrase/topoisomerase IV subunit B